MANEIYVITPTDGDSTREFSVSPYTTNGAESPASSTLHANALNADTSLLFHGKGESNYGDNLQENFYYLLENFSNSVEPKNPIPGQLWLDTNDYGLKSFNVNELPITNVDALSQTITITPKGETNAKYFQKYLEALVERFSGGFRFSVYITDNRSLVGANYIASSASIVNTNEILININGTTGIDNLITIPKSIGHWKPLTFIDHELLQNTFSDLVNPPYSTFKPPVEHYDFGENKLLNVSTLSDIDPNANDFDGVNRSYVYNNYLNVVVGGTVSGNVSFDGVTSFNNNINFNGQTTSNTPIPTNSDQVANKQYVDDEIANVSLSAGATDLDGLSDVVIGSLVNGQVLQYNAGVWENSLLTITEIGDTNVSTLTDGQVLAYNSLSTNWENVDITLDGLTSTDFVLIAGGGSITSGTLKLDSQPGQNGVAGAISINDASTIGYVNTVLSSLNFADHTNEITHIITPTNTDDGDFLTRHHINDFAYPNVDADIVMNEFSKALRDIQKPIHSDVFVTDGVSTTYTFNDNYIVGYNNLQVFVNGVKQIASTRPEHAMGNSITGVYYTLPTGLTTSTNYSFDIDVDGNPLQTVTINGTDAQTYYDLMVALNVEFVNLGLNCSASIYAGALHVQSLSVGSVYSITITDIDLVASITGMFLLTAEAGFDYDYVELGEFGTFNAVSIDFNYLIPINNRIEGIIINNPSTNDGNLAI